MKPKHPVYAYWSLLVLQLGFIFFLSSLHKTPEFPKLLDVYNMDKLAHICIYSVMGYLLAQAVLYSFNWNSRKLLLLLALGFGAFYGVSDEFHQYFVPTRSVSLGDVAADIAGTLIGTLIFIQVMKRRGYFLDAKDKRV